MTLTAVDGWVGWQPLHSFQSGAPGWQLMPVPIYAGLSNDEQLRVSHRACHDAPAPAPAQRNPSPKPDPNPVQTQTRPNSTPTRQPNPTPRQFMFMPIVSRPLIS